MSVLPIIVAPDPRLKRRSEIVEEVTDTHRKLIDDMLDTMYHAPGIGLAAPQVGVLQRIIIVDLSKGDENPHPYKMINPKITWSSDKFFDYDEGCLSLPEHYAQVKRPNQIHLSYIDPTGHEQFLDAEDLLATCIQHEIDHLDGVLFVDHISKLRRDLIIRKLKKYKSTLPADA
jgi:peptide deformylase